MYETYFGLRQRPFRASPDSVCYYPASNHEAALAGLLNALHDGEGLALLTGQPGTGKTLLCHLLLERLGDEVTGLFLMHSRIEERLGLLQTILYDLSLPYEGRTEQELRLALIDFLLSQYKCGRRTVVIMDEAQYLTPDLLEELRLLGNLESRQGKALQVVLSAQPSILDTLCRPELAAFSQRLAVRVHLEPLVLAEAADYVLHQLRACGAHPGSVITEEALEILARSANGVPRLLNQGAHRALALAFTGGAEQVDAEAVLEALGQLSEDQDDATLSSFPRSSVGTEAGLSVGRISNPSHATEDSENEREPTEAALSSFARSSVGTEAGVSTEDRGNESVPDPQLSLNDETEEQDCPREMEDEPELTCRLYASPRPA